MLGGINILCINNSLFVCVCVLFKVCFFAFVQYIVNLYKRHSKINQKINKLRET